MKKKKTRDSKTELMHLTTESESALMMISWAKDRLQEISREAEEVKQNRENVVEVYLDKVRDEREVIEHLDDVIEQNTERGGKIQQMLENLR